MSTKSRYPLKVKDGFVLVGSDAHLWPKQNNTALRAFVKVAKLYEPDAIVLNGDVIDGASISRHPKIGWEYQPTVAEEIAEGKQFLRRVKEASPKSDRIWTLGNHDARFEMRLAEKAPEYEKVKGIHLKDHFPEWIPAWSVDVNNNTIIKHRWKGGVHAALNNAKDSGRHTITGHNHALNVSAYTDWNGTRFGADGGTLADPNGPQFAYGEDNPRNHRSGFLILYYDKKGKLMWPTAVPVIDEKKGLIWFEGKEMKV